MSDGYELEELTRIEAALDALVSPTSEDVFQATRPFDERAIASVAATRGGGGGGAQTATDGITTVDPVTSFRLPAGTLTDLGGGEAAIAVQTQLLGPLHFSFNSPNLSHQFKLADLAAGVIALRAWIVVTEAFASATDFAYIGVGGPSWDDPSQDWNRLRVADVTVVSFVGDGYVIEAAPDPSQLNPDITVLTAAGALVVSLAQSGSPSTGQADAYALLAIPAT